jgi:hypothetical protein
VREQIDKIHRCTPTSNQLLIFFTIKAKAVSGITLLFSDFALRLDTKLSTNATNLAIYRHCVTASNHLRYVLIPKNPNKLIQCFLKTWL